MILKVLLRHKQKRSVKISRDIAGSFKLKAAFVTRPEVSGVVSNFGMC